jgi:hypothetical protein
VGGRELRSGGPGRPVGKKKTTYAVTTIRFSRLTSFAVLADPLDMPVAQTQEISHGLTGLEPESRALLELSTRRRVPDADLAQLLGVDTDEVRRRRQVAVEVLAVQLRLGTREELIELEAALRGDEAWQPHTDGNATDPAAEQEPNGQPEAGPEPGTVALTADEAAIPALATEAFEAEEELEAAADAPEAEAAHRRSRALTVTATGLLALVAGGAVLALTSGGDDGSDAANTMAPPVPSGRLQHLPGATGAGRAALLHGNDLRIRLTGLPGPRRGFYEVWLYNSVGDARSIGRLRNGALSARLPAGAGRYRLVDVSREPRDGNPNHSGASVARVPLSTLRR